ncbi:hypothetical protein A8H32_32040 [Burkholderia thailandensis]|nr:hypothetical protein A8H32_32040 [Burkholderia thailandensis]
MTVHPRGWCRRCGSCLQAPFVRTETQAIVRRPPTADRRPPTADRRPPTARRIRTTHSAAGFVRDVGPDKSKKHKQKQKAPRTSSGAPWATAENASALRVAAIVRPSRPASATSEACPCPRAGSLRA